MSDDENAWKVLTENNEDRDGKIVALMGTHGAGKTVLMQRIARQKLREGGTVIWRSKRKDTWQVFLKSGDVNIIAQKGIGEIYFDSQVTKGEDEPKLSGLEVNYCSGPDQALKMLKKDAVNIIITCNMKTLSEAAWWTLFFYFIAVAKNKSFMNIFIDEIHELFKMNPESDIWHFTGSFVEAMDNFRKSMVNFYFSAHEKKKMDDHIFSTSDLWAFMRGSRKFSASRINSQALLDGLGRGQVIVEYDTGFAEFQNEIASPELLPSYNIIVEGEQSFDYFLRPDYLRILDLEPWYTQDCSVCGYHWSTQKNQAPRCPRCGGIELEVRLGKFSDALFTLNNNPHSPPSPQRNQLKNSASEEIRGGGGAGAGSKATHRKKRGD